MGVTVTVIAMAIWRRTINSTAHLGCPVHLTMFISPWAHIFKNDPSPLETAETWSQHRALKTPQKSGLAVYPTVEVSERWSS